MSNDNKHLLEESNPKKGFLERAEGLREKIMGYDSLTDKDYDKLSYLNRLIQTYEEELQLPRTQLENVRPYNDLEREEDQDLVFRILGSLCDSQNARKRIKYSYRLTDTDRVVDGARILLDRAYCRTMKEGTYSALRKGVDQIFRDVKDMSRNFEYAEEHIAKEILGWSLEFDSRLDDENGDYWKNKKKKR